ncbi:transposase [Paenibacillus larvae]|nr:transposase [Paenibacillus larvae]MDT2242337.1 transposase [Paenibacillus larvae]
MRRTKYSNEFKVQVVKEALETRNKAAVARRYELASNIESGKWGSDFGREVPLRAQRSCPKKMTT